MKKNFNLKNIKEEMKRLYEIYLKSNMKDDSYIEFYNSLKNLYSFNFLSYEDFQKIYEYDNYLFNNINF